MRLGCPAFAGLCRAALPSVCFVGWHMGATSSVAALTTGWLWCEACFNRCCAAKALRLLLPAAGPHAPSKVCCHVPGRPSRHVVCVHACSWASGTPSPPSTSCRQRPTSRQSTSARRQAGLEAPCLACLPGSCCSRLLHVAASAPASLHCWHYAGLCAGMAGSAPARPPCLPACPPCPPACPRPCPPACPHSRAACPRLCCAVLCCAQVWLKFPREGSGVTPPHPSNDFKWKDYCSTAFK